MSETTGHGGLEGPDPREVEATILGDGWRLTLLAALMAFYQEHARFGELGGGVYGDRVWMACSCGAVINRHQDD